MAGERPRDYATEGFGRVSRTVGTVFRGVLLVATLAGICSLAVLVAFVAIDAFQPHRAEPGWYATYLLALVLPAVTTGLLLRRRAPGAATRGIEAMGVPLAGAMVGAGVAVLFIEVLSANAVFVTALSVALAGGATLAYGRWRTSAGSVERLVVAALAYGAALEAVWRLMYAAPLLPARWLLTVAAVGLPVAGLVRYWARGRWGDRGGDLAGAATVAVATLGGAVGLVTGLGGVTGVLLGLAIVVPTGLYLAHLAMERPDQRVGLALPAVIVAGAVVGWLVVQTAGLQSPPSWFDWSFLTSAHSNTPEQAGVYPALVGSVMLMVVVVVLSFPLGVGAAIYLEEYASDGRFTRLVQVNIANLAGVPSVVYGLLALGVFIRLGGLTTGSLLVGGIALSLLILPIVIISAQEAIRAVPDSARQASYGMGATRYQTVRRVVLPRALPGILTGTILALGRALGETAPLIMIGAPAVGSIPSGLQSKVVALPMQVFTWASTFASPAFFDTALAAGVVTLLILLLVMNSVAIVVRNRYERRS